MSRPWATIDTSHRVLAVARTVTSLNRILDILPALADDSRIQVWFTVDEGSEFSHGVAERIRSLGARIVSWATAVETSFDLILAASDNSDLHELTGPLLLVPHGAGYQKYSPHSDAFADTARELSGFAPSGLCHDGHPVPARIGLSHDNQLAQVAALAPTLVGRATVIGDPCMDQLMLLSRDRDRIRGSLRLEMGQSLVVVTSTWGSESTLARWPSLPADLLAQLPYDQFRVAAVLHPNIWAYHGSWQVRHWLSRARAAGLILASPTGPWQSLLAAADCVVGDHGSLSAYATGLRCPLLLAAFGDSEVPPGTSMAELGERIPRLIRQRSLAEQIGDAIDTVDHLLLDHLADRVFAYRGDSQARLRAVMYDLLRLTPPSWTPARFAPPMEPLSSTRPLAFRVSTEFHHLPREHSMASLRRFPAILSNPAQPQDDSHLVVGAREVDERLAQNAAVIVTDRPMTAELARVWATTTLTDLPGCRIAAAPVAAGTVVAMVRDGRLVRASTTDVECDPHLLASAVYLLIRRPDGSGLQNLAITTGSRVIEVEFSTLLV